MKHFVGMPLCCERDNPIDFTMGNAVGSLFSGLGQAFGQLLGHPLDFLSGQSCNSICAPTWDFACYIENFCVAHLLKFVMVAMLVYFVLLFLYLLFNLGICQCICHTLCRMTWACFATCFSALDFCCSYLCYKLRSVKRTRRRRRRKRDIEQFASPIISTSSSEDEYELEEMSINGQPRNHGHRRSHFNRRRNYKNEHLRRSLKPTNHRARVEFSGRPVHLHRNKTLKNIGPIHDHIRVTRSSTFSQKGSRNRNGIHRKRR
ncbi:hypothetical protein PHJA_001126800 [Phtheirospermum japonicum]|uniref:Uncharacterized protein n=1 Tax=Phtheirospermum japonicum TaxID=374723 RepID=A0A830BQM2_9LAMI|nr:hypothetical protein PHJA_001126800 [Phtheirospermum japonicum]